MQKDMQKVGDIRWIDDRIAAEKCNLMYYASRVEQIKQTIIKLEEQRRGLENKS
jgi:hypothetical protein